MGKGPKSKLSGSKATTAAPSPEKSYSTKQFYLEDFSRTLFPLNTNRILIEHGEKDLQAYIAECANGIRSFAPQHRAHSAKDPLHLRRTVKLDPVAEYFIYDLIYKHRAKFRKPHTEDRAHFGYRFVEGMPSSASQDFSAFKSRVSVESLFTSDFMNFDISNYFNCLYHHDLEAWLAALNVPDDDVQLFSKFLREINAGRSVDCLPHGLYPTKMIGNDFLRFIEESAALKSKTILRFMDDVYIFGDSKGEVEADFYRVQQLLGLKGLNVNSAKTGINELQAEKTETSISAVKKKLLQRRRTIISGSLYEGESPGEPVNIELSADELNEMNAILKGGELEEDDAELALTVMSTHTEDVLDLLPGIIQRFPHLAKHVHRFCSGVEDKERVADIVHATLLSVGSVQEYQLFWFAAMLESYLLNTNRASEIISGLLDHRNRTDISAARLLEIPDLRFGLPEVRYEFLSSGRSDWLSWSSAVGSRSSKPAARNYILEYFMKSSPMNSLIGKVVKSLP